MGRKEDKVILYALPTRFFVVALYPPNSSSSSDLVEYNTPSSKEADPPWEILALHTISALTGVIAEELPVTAMLVSVAYSSIAPASESSPQEQKMLAENMDNKIHLVN